MPTVLFVDDEIEVINSTKRILHQMSGDWTFHYATSGEEAITLLEGPEQVDVCITDIMMPGINGYELVQLILDKHPETMPIVLSGLCEETDRLEFLRMKVPFFEKPFPIEELTSTISLKLLNRLM
ncbi:response regulator [Terasakiella sp. SH-1]|uniref:response regulator n=1 Tax=Terasakiella sp. SH-1 TaxID=2560057 RepID=UPI001073EFA6|nr:response regulator [Terasakiella sp. SH-1]